MKIPTLYERLKLTAHIQQLIRQVGRHEALTMIERIVEKELAREKQERISSDCHTVD
jgi:hypothetical protein